MDIEKLLRSLKDHKVKYVVVGAAAFPIHSYARATLDFDIFIEPSRTNANRCLVALKDFGYDLTDVTVKDLLNKKLLIRQYLLEVDVHPFVKGVRFENVWKNRLKGTLFGIYEKKYNNTITGESWEYPEFKGYYSNLYAVKLQTREVPVTVASATGNLFLHLFTPGEAKYSKVGVRGEVNPPFPSGNISFLHAISPIGTKFTRADAEGPQSQKNLFNGEILKGTLYFRFGE